MKQPSSLKRNNNPSRSVAPVAKANALRTTSSNSILLRGCDRIVTVVDASTYDAGSAIVSIPITPDIAYRLGSTARTFQRIKYRSLKFRVNAQCATTTAGGYVAGFVKDAADVLPTGTASVPYLMSNTGSFTQPWWKSTVHNVKVPQKLFYTEAPTRGADAVREYCPGQFHVLVDSKPSQICPVTVDLEWVVELHDATFRKESDQTAISAIVADHTLNVYGLPATSNRVGHILISPIGQTPKDLTPTRFATFFGFLPDDKFCVRIPTPVDVVLTGENVYQSVEATHIRAYLVNGGLGIDFHLAAYNDTAHTIQPIIPTLWNVYDVTGAVTAPFTSAIYDNHVWTHKDKFVPVSFQDEPIPGTVFDYLYPRSYSLPSSN